MTNEERQQQMEARNAAIAACYGEGKTLKQCASQFRLGRMRVLQILKAAGVWTPRVKSKRTEFLGINVSEETKQTLKAKADQEGVSVSEFAAEKLDEAVAE